MSACAHVATGRYCWNKCILTSCGYRRLLICSHPARQDSGTAKVSSDLPFLPLPLVYIRSVSMEIYHVDKASQLQCMCTPVQVGFETSLSSPLCFHHKPPGMCITSSAGPMRISLGGARPSGSGTGEQFGEWLCTLTCDLQNTGLAVVGFQLDLFVDCSRNDIGRFHYCGIMVVTRNFELYSRDIQFSTNILTKFSRPMILSPSLSLSVPSHSSYDFSSSVELYSLENDLPELMDVSRFFPDLAAEAVGYMDEAHSPGPCCGCLGPHHN